MSTTIEDPSTPLYITIRLLFLFLSHFLFDEMRRFLMGVCWFYLCSFSEPQPSYSAYREASFGHVILEIKNRTHAYYTWHRNQDSEPVAADSLWI